MNAFPLVVLLVLLAPLIEIWVMIDIGSVIGAGWTVLAIVATAVIGGGVVRFQGVGVYQRLQETAERGEVPAMEMLEGLALFISGVMLLLPGFITDALGFMLLVPPFRRWIVLHLLRRFFIVPPTDAGFSSPQRDSHHPRQTIEGSSRRLDDDV